MYFGSAHVATVEQDLQTGDTEIFYYHADHLGSTNLITDAQGNVVQHLEFDPWGSIHHSEGPSVAKRHLYTGKEQDETGLIYFGARYYDPSLGRWLQADPTVQYPYDPQTLNRYTFVRNNPLRYVDPDGYGFFSKLKRFFKETIGSFFGAMGGAFIGGLIGNILFPGGGGLLAGAYLGASMGGGAGYAWQHSQNPWAGAFSGLLWGVAVLPAMGLGAGFALGVGLPAATGAWVGAVAFSGGVTLAMGGSLEDAAVTMVGTGTYGAAGYAIMKTVGVPLIERLTQAYYETPMGARTSQRYWQRALSKYNQGELSRAYRYASAEEAQVIERTRMVPNVDATGRSKSVHFSPERYTTVSQAEEALQMGRFHPHGPKPPPTHRVEVDPTGMRWDRVGPVRGGSGTEAITRESIPIIRMDPLLQE